jgi:TolB protein
MTHRSPSLLSAFAAFALALALLAPLGRGASSQESTGPVEPGRTLEAPPPEVAVPAGEELPANTVVIDVDAPERALYRIAVPAILGEQAMGAEGGEVLRNDFRLISLFDVLDPRGFTADLEAEDLGLAPASWQTVGAQGVIKGRIVRDGGRIRVEMRLYELARGTTASLTRTYAGGAGELRGFMHDFANEVVRVLTGRAAAFGTRITFARRVREGRKDVYVASFDGHNVARVSTGRGVSMLPAFGPGGIWYSVLSETGMFITRTGEEERPLIDAPESINMGASFCGGRIYFTSTRDGNAEIYSSNPDGTDLRRLTDNPGIDVSPACGGPGGTIAFVSNRHGSPQIFGMNNQGGNVRRLTYRGSYNQTPAWCPDAEQSLLAFTGRAAGLDVFTVNIQSQQYTRITQGQGVNKDPAFSPDCRMLAFYSTRGGIFIANPEGLNQQLVIPGVAETLRWSR